MCCLLEKMLAICPEDMMTYFRKNCPSMMFKVGTLNRQELFCSLCLLDSLIGRIEAGARGCTRNELIDLYVNRLEVMERLHLRYIWLQEDAPKVERLLYGV